MKKIELLPAEQQEAWRWQAAVNFILVGAGTGFYLFSFLVTVFEDTPFAMSKPISYGLLAPILVTMGFLTLTTEAGRPSRGIYLFRNIRHAWLSRETFFFSVFVPIAILDLFIPNLVFRALSIASALALMSSQGSILYQIRAITTWNVLLVPVFFISSGLASGGGVFLLIGGLTGSPLILSAIITVMAALSANLAIWFLYLNWIPSITFRAAIERLRRPFAMITIVGLGHILPLTLLTILVMFGKAESKWTIYVETVMGMAVLFGVILQKKALVLRASNMKAIIIEADNN